MFDYHTHSLFSHDGVDTVEELLAAAAAKGLSELCVTDHCDMVGPPFDGAGYRKMLTEARTRNRTGVRLLFGLEMGEGFWHKEEARALLESIPFDLVIGSVHMLRGQEDFYFIDYRDTDHCYRLLDQYWAETLELVEWGQFDVLGHICYPLRYMIGRCGHDLPDVHERYRPIMCRVFEALVRDGKGIEVNLHGLYRGGYGKTLPPPDVLTLYRACGGEIVTVGTDAHRAVHVGAAVSQGLEILKAAGFTHITAYRERTPRFVPIP